jgi:hypothetical protein
MWNRFHIWKQFRLFWIRGSYTLPIRLHDARSETVPPWYAMPCESISGDWRSELKKNAIARAIPGFQAAARDR